MRVDVKTHSFSLLNVHAPSEEKRDDSKDSFYEELEQVFFYHFPKYHKIFYKETLTQKWRDIIFSNRQLGMRVYLRIVIIMLFENGKILHINKSSCYKHDKYTWTSPDGKTHNQMHHIFIDLR